MNKWVGIDNNDKNRNANTDVYLQNWLQAQNSSNGNQMLTGVVNTLLHYKWSILLFLLLGGLLGGLKAINEDPVYRAQLTMLVEPSNRPSSGQPVLFNPYGFRFYETQYELIRSRSVADRVVQDLRLLERPSLDQLLVPPSFGVKLKQWMASLPYFDRLISVTPSPSSFDLQSLTPEQKLARQQWLSSVIQRGVRVTGAQKTQLVTVSFDSRDPDFAAEVANALVEAYISLGLESQLNRSEKTSRWLTQRLEEVRINLSESEQRLQEYLLDTGSVDLQRSREISSQELSALNQEYLAARARYDDLSKRYGTKHPRMTAVRAELFAAKRRYDNASQGVIVSKEQEFELSKLERDIEVNQQLYDLFLTKFREADLSNGERLSSARVVDRARVPSAPVYPNEQRIILLFSLGGLFLGAGLAFMREQLDTTFKNPRQLESQLQMPVLGIVPKSNERDDIKPEREFIRNTRAPFAEAINHIRTGIVYSDVDNPPQVVLVTSSVQGEGKTTTSSNLALAFGRSGKTLLIDADLRRPRLQTVVKKRHKNGLVDYVAGNASLDECLLPDPRIKHLDILHCGTVPPNPLEVLASAKMRSVMQELRKTYDTIVIDTAPILPASDAIALGQIADAVVLAVQSDSTRTQLVEDALKRLRSAHLQPVGLVLTQVDVERLKSYRYGGYYSTYYQTD